MTFHPSDLNRSVRRRFSWLYETLVVVGLLAFAYFAFTVEAPQRNPLGGLMEIVAPR